MRRLLMTQQGGELDVVAEYAGCELGDERRRRRLMKSAGDLNREPAASFPLASGDDAALEGTYRFLNNEAVTADGILGGHAARTVERASAYDWVVAIHDTSHFEFPGEALRKGLAPLRGKGQGFWGHFMLLVGGDDRHPLGIVGMQARSRSKTSRKRTLTRAERRNDPNNESRRWYEGVEQAEAEVAGASRIVHVMAREGDSYELLAQLCASHSPFVIRGFHNRRLDEEPYERLFEALDDTETARRAARAAVAPERSRSGTECDQEPPGSATTSGPAGDPCDERDAQAKPRCERGHAAHARRQRGAHARSRNERQPRAHRVDPAHERAHRKRR